MLTNDAQHTDLQAVLQRFHRDGYARLGKVLNIEGLSALRERCNALMLGKTTYPGMFFQHDSPSGRYKDLSYGKGWVGPSLAYRKVEGLEADSLILTWIKNDLFERLAREVIGARVSLYRAVLWNKAVLAGTELPWHQDDGRFWGIDRSPQLQLWTALDDAPAGAGCVEVVPGTHRYGLASAEGGTVQKVSLEAWKAAQRKVALEASAGEVLLIHNHVWHRSGHNRTQSPRRAISISLMDAATKCLRKRRKPRQFMQLFGTASVQVGTDSSWHNRN